MRRHHDPLSVASRRQVAAIASAAPGEEAMQALEEIHMAGHSPMEWTPRGVENAILNVFVLDEATVQAVGTPEGCAWVDVTDLYDLALAGKFIRHQVNRFVMMMNYVRSNINAEVPVLRVLTV